MLVAERQRGNEVATSEHAFELVSPLRLVKLLDPGCGRVTGGLLDPQVLGCDARQLGKMGDRDDLRVFRQPLEHPADAVRSDATDARVNLVEDESFATRHSGERERDPGQLAARRGVSDRGKRQTSVGAHEEDHFVVSGRAVLALPYLDLKLSFAHADIPQFGRDGKSEPVCPGGPSA